jgi:hypothetical protein
MMQPPMSWGRVWRIIHWIQSHDFPYTTRDAAYLDHEVFRMNPDQRQRFDLESGLVLQRVVFQ